MSLKEKPKTSKGSKQGLMGSHVPSSPLTPNVVSAPASMKVCDQTASAKTRAEKDDPAPTSHPIDEHSDPEPSDSDSQRSCTKSDCTPTPSSPPPPTLEQKVIATATKATGSAEPIKSKSAAITAESSPFHLIAYCLFLGFMATVTMHCARVLISREGAMACSTKACNYYTKTRSFSRVALHYSLAMTPEVPYYVESLNAMAKSSTTYIKEVAVELPPVKAVETWARTTQNFIYATPPETQMLILASILWSAHDRAMSSVVKLPPVAAIDNWTRSTLSYIHATPPEVQLIVFNAKLQAAQDDIESAVDFIMEKVELMKTKMKLLLASLQVIAEDAIADDRVQAVLGLTKERCELMEEMAKQIVAQDRIQATLVLIKAESESMRKMTEDVMAHESIRAALEFIKAQAELAKEMAEELLSRENAEATLESMKEKAEVAKETATV